MPPIDLLAGCAAAALWAVHVGSALIAAHQQGSPDDPGEGCPQDVPPITIIRPLRGVEPFSRAALQSTFALSPAPAEIIFCVDRSDDPIVALVERLIETHDAIPARLLIGRDVICDNPKLNNIAKGWRDAQYDWIALIDSNVLLPSDALARLWARHDDAAGMVCSPPIGRAPRGFAAHLECSFLNAHQARWQSAADWWDCGFAQGKTMFFHRRLIDAAGGLGLLGAEAAEDAAATKLVRRSGLKVRLVDRFFDQPLGDRTLREVLDRQQRWAKLRRSSFPLLFATEILSGGLAMTGLTFLASASAGAMQVPITLAAVVAWYGVEQSLARFVGWPGAWYHAVVRDLAMPAIWVRSWLSSEFTWQGQPLRADRAPVPTASSSHPAESADTAR